MAATQPRYSEHPSRQHAACEEHDIDLTALFD